MSEIKVQQIGQAEYHVPVHSGVAAEAGKDVVGATITIDTGAGVHETYDEAGNLVNRSGPE